MSSEKSDAVVIRQTDFSETSRVVTFFTRESGKLAMMAKGSRRRRNPYDDSMDLLAESSIVFLRKTSGRLQLLTEAALRRRFRPPQTTASMQSLYAGYYIAELLDGLLEEDDPHPALYDATIVALDRLQRDNARPLRTLARFETQLLKELGHLPSFTHCLKCEQPVQRTPSDGGATRDGKNEEYVHWVSQGGVLCERCRSPEYRQDRIAAGTLQLLQSLASAGEADLARLTVREQHVREARRILDSAIGHLLERRPRMLRYLGAV